MAGVYGRVVLDAYRINTPTPTIMVTPVPLAPPAPMPPYPPT